MVNRDPIGVDGVVATASTLEADTLAALVAATWYLQVTPALNPEST